MVCLRLLAIAASAIGVVAATEQDESIAAALAHDLEACEANDDDDDSSLQLRQLRAQKQMQLETAEEEGAAAAALLEVENDKDSHRSESAEAADKDLEISQEDKEYHAQNEAELIEEDDTNKERKAWPPYSPYAPRRQAWCVRDTKRQCGSVHDCPESLGQTVCDQGTCKCQREHCFRDGYCMNISPMKPLAATCQADTSGTCAWFGCDGSRGPTECQNGRCVCKEGTCAVNGMCQPNGDTGGRCGPYGGCPPQHGNAVCIHGKCVCAGQLVAVRGVCVSRQMAFRAAPPH
mmetsp:Transcript_7791/g.17004  ORF Transcript_7791/g.17004 Transcript_7791/m.17004 type:complete len:291 (+) Transcript_7791:106-978(+)